MVAGKWRDSVSAFSRRKGSDFRAKKIGEWGELPGRRFVTKAHPTASRMPPTATEDLRFMIVLANAW